MTIDTHDRWHGGIAGSVARFRLCDFQAIAGADSMNWAELDRRTMEHCAKMAEEVALRQVDSDRPGDEAHYDACYAIAARIRMQIPTEFGPPNLTARHIFAAAALASAPRLLSPQEAAEWSTEVADRLIAALSVAYQP